MTPSPGPRDPLTLLLYAGAAVLLVGAPFFFYPLFLTKVLCYALFACAFNLLLGSCGLLSFGHAAYFGAAAYVAGHAAKVWGLPFEACLALGVMASALLGTIFGYISIRRQGIYFAMITLALAQMVYFLSVLIPMPKYTVFDSEFTPTLSANPSKPKMKPPLTLTPDSSLLE
jgi:branched-chain amino acid transport system permease protein